MSEDQIKFGGKPRFFNKNKESGNHNGPVEAAPQRNGGGDAPQRNGNDGGNVEAKPFYPKPAPAAPSNQGGNCKYIKSILKHTLLTQIT